MHPQRSQLDSAALYTVSVLESPGEIFQDSLVLVVGTFDQLDPGLVDSFRRGRDLLAQEANKG